MLVISHLQLLGPIFCGISCSHHTDGLVVSPEIRSVEEVGKTVQLTACLITDYSVQLAHQDAGRR